MNGAQLHYNIVKTMNQIEPISAGQNRFERYVRSILEKTSFLTYDDITRILPVKKQTLYNDRASGKLRSSLTLSKAVFACEDVLRYAITKGYVEVNQ